MKLGVEKSGVEMSFNPSIDFEIQNNQCGMTSSGGFQSDNGQPNLAGSFIENTIIVQYDPLLQMVFDQARKIRCYDYYEKSVTFKPLQGKIKSPFKKVTVKPVQIQEIEEETEAEVELVSKELNHFGVIAGLFRQIGGHSSRFELVFFF